MLAARGIAGFGLMLSNYENMRRSSELHLDELGQTGVFLASPGAAAITGQVIYVDGGYEPWACSVSRSRELRGEG